MLAAVEHRDQVRVGHGERQGAVRHGRDLRVLADQRPGDAPLLESAQHLGPAAAHQLGVRGATCGRRRLGCGGHRRRGSGGWGCRRRGRGGRTRDRGGRRRGRGLRLRDRPCGRDGLGRDGCRRRGRGHGRGARGRRSSRRSRRSHRSRRHRRRGAGVRGEQPCAQQFQVQARGRGADHVGEGVVDQVRGARGAREAEAACLVAHPGRLVLGHRAQSACARLTGGAQDQEVAEPLEQVLHEPAGLVTGGHDPLDHVEERGAVRGRDRVHRVVEERRVGEAQQRDRAVVGHPRLIGARHQLVEHGQGVAHRSAAGADHQVEHASGDGDVLRLAQRLQVRAQDGRRHQPERVVVRPRPDGADHLLRLRGREDEAHVRRRLLDQLEERVEALGGDHVGLVQDEDLVAVARGGESGALAQLASVVHAVVRRGVDLDHVHRAGASARELDAGRAGAAGRVRGPLLAVEAAREDARGGGLAAAARPREQVGVVDAVRAQRLHERRGDVLLTHHVREGVGTVAAVQGGGHGYDSSGGLRQRGQRCPQAGPGHERTPHAPDRARLPLLHS